MIVVKVSLVQQTVEDLTSESLPGGAANSSSESSPEGAANSSSESSDVEATVEESILAYYEYVPGGDEVEYIYEYQYYVKPEDELPTGESGEVEVKELSAAEKISQYEEKQARISANKAKQRLKAQGFEASPTGGFTFPGVVISEVDNKAASSAIVKEVELLPEPSLIVSEISSNGELEFIFN